jgi:hypothetical protein
MSKCYAGTVWVHFGIFFKSIDLLIYCEDWSWGCVINQSMNLFQIQADPDTGWEINPQTIGYTRRMCHISEQMFHLIIGTSQGKLRLSTFKSSWMSAKYDSISTHSSFCRCFTRVSSVLAQKFELCSWVYINWLHGTEALFLLSFSYFTALKCLYKCCNETLM